MATIEFTGNYEDLSTDKGLSSSSSSARSAATGTCRASSPRRSGWRPPPSQAAGNIFGGILGRAAYGAYEIQRAVGGPAHDAALKEAVAEIKPLFIQCTRCGKWICEPVCFNKKAGLCEGCAPDLDEEMASAQAEAAREQVQQKAREIDWMKQRDVATVTGAVCPHCGAKTQGGKFCGDCGKPLSAKKKCVTCGTEAEGSPKFCPECGGRFA